MTDAPWFPQRLVLVLTHPHSPTLTTHAYKHKATNFQSVSSYRVFKEQASACILQYLLTNDYLQLFKIMKQSFDCIPYFLYQAHNN